MIVKPDTKFFLAESLKELSQKKSVDKITVKEIVKNCGLTPPTFYNHFHDKYALIEWIYSSAAEKIMSRIGTDGYTWRDTLADAINYFFANRDFLNNLIVNTSGQTSFINYAAQFNTKILSDYIKESQNLKTLPESVEISVKVYCYGTVCMICEVLTKPPQISSKDFVKMLEESLPESLKKYLYKTSPK